MCTSSLSVIPRDNLLKKIIPEKTKRIHGWLVVPEMMPITRETNSVVKT